MQISEMGRGQKMREIGYLQLGAWTSSTMEFSASETPKGSATEKGPQSLATEREHNSEVWPSFPRLSY